MIQRCTNKNHPRYSEWGGRGVTIDPVWMDFITFRDDMGPRPEGMTLDRKDNASGYGPSNCRWATPTEQQQNTKRVRLIEIDGVARSITGWCKVRGIVPSTAFKRIERGMSPLDAIARY
jgi:hypothetical protein